MDGSIDARIVCAATVWPFPNVSVRESRNQTSRRVHLVFLFLPLALAFSCPLHCWRHTQQRESMRILTLSDDSPRSTDLMHDDVQAIDRLRVAMHAPRHPAAA